MLLAWFADPAAAQPGVLHRGVLTRLRRVVRSQPKTGDTLLLSAMRLRCAVTAVGAAFAARAAPSSRHLDVVKRAGVAALGAGRIVTDANRAAFRFDFGGAPPEAALLGTIAWAAIDLFRSDQLPRLKQCPACDCRWLFLDTTRNGSRRWCDMATCGNRNKAMRFRRLGASSGRRAQ
jgi:predicted RNA-binding Zn ribbon-like protein